ncbi:MAG: HEAT repeat domain-containing protein [Planctomycetota bacterium]
MPRLPLLATTLALIVLAGLAPRGAAQEATPPTLDELSAQWRDEKVTGPEKYRIALRIGSLRQELGTRFLAKTFAEEKDPTLRSYLLYGLARDPGGEGVMALILATAADASEPFAVRAAAVRAVADLDIDWAGWYRDFLRRGENANFAGTVVAAVAARGEEKAWPALLELDGLDDEGVSAAVTGTASRVFGLEKAYEPFVKPHLRRSAPARLVRAALEALGRARDPRFAKELRRLDGAGLQPGINGVWIGLAAAYDDMDHLRLVLDLAEAPDVNTERAFFGAAFDMKDPEVLKWFRDKGASSDERRTRRAAIRSMRAHPHAENPRALARLAKCSDDQLAIEAVEALGHQERQHAEAHLVDLRRSRDVHLAAEAMAAHFACSDGADDVIEGLVEVAARSRVWQLRVAAMELLAPKHATRAREALRANADHRKPSVRTAAYDALTWLREKETVDFLIERLEAESGRNEFEVSEALTDLTTFHWGPDPERWRTWWTKVREGYPLPPKKERGTAKRDGNDRYGRFYGMDVTSKRVAFVIDTSGSMEAPVRVGEAFTRLQQAKRELAAAIGGFTGDHRFQILSFSNAPQLMGRELIAANRRNKATATEWVADLRSGGGTNIYDSLERALELDEVDTIFLLTDGSPSAGKYVDQDEIRIAIRRANRFLRVRINTVGIGVRGPVADFLRELARENWGESVVLD